jgi:predicted AAA+ superfamily ATPase
VTDVRSAVARDQGELYELLAQFNARMKVLGPRLERLVGAAEKAVDRNQDKLYSILSQGDEVAGRVNRAAQLTLEDLVAMTRNLAQASRNLISLTERLRNDPSLLIRSRGSGP